MFSRMYSVVAGVSLFMLLSCPAAWADGFIVLKEPMVRPDRPERPRATPLEVKYHHVDAEITDNIGVTKIDQVFYNPNARQLEGTYIFPLADDVSISKFSMYMDGKEVRGELLDHDKAAEIYQDIVNRKKDPALLEYVGSRMYRARVFPIPASGEVRIKLEYTQTIETTGGLAMYRYPLNTEKFSSAPLQEVSVRVKIVSQLPLVSVFCPSHDAEIKKKDAPSDVIFGVGLAHEAVVGYEAKNVKPDKDFIVGYQTSDEAFGMALLAFRESGQDGFFMARICPGVAADEKPLPKDITFVIDTSGSMAGKKIEQAREALRFCLANLNVEDRFNIVAFSTEPRPWRGELVPATESNVSDARTHASKLEAAGGTCINDAVVAAMKQGQRLAGKKRPYMVVFLTDGLPTVGERDIDKILANVRDANPGRVRLFAFGLGDDVNTKLLDKMSEDNHGSRQYVSEQEDLELKLSGFYAMIDHPVLSDVQLSFGDAEVYDLYPKVMPDLFKGSELILFGRYRNAGEHAVTLGGHRGDSDAVFTWAKEFPARATTADFLPRLWANRKIGFLLDEMRMNGENPELKSEIVRLAKRYGILTPYTSFLVVEESELRGHDLTASPAPASESVVRRRFGRSPARADYLYAHRGAGAVRSSKTVGKMKTQSAASAVEAETNLFLGVGGAVDGDHLDGLKAGDVDRPVRYVGAKTFYRDGDRWVDSAYEALSRDKDGKTNGGKDAGKPAAITKLRLFSEAYYDLIAAHPEAGKYFALGKHVLVVIDDKAYETFEQETGQDGNSDGASNGFGDAGAFGADGAFRDDGSRSVAQ